MRILCQCDGYLPDVIGGLEVLSAHLHEELRRRGHEILVVSSCIGGQPEGAYRSGGTRLHKLDFGSALQRTRIADIARLQREVVAIAADFRADVLHLNHAMVSSFFFLRRGGLTAQPRVLTPHAPWPAKAKGGLQNRLVQEADIVIAISRSMAEDAVRQAPSIRDKLSIIPNALPLPPVEPTPPPPGTMTFACIGRLVDDKGADVAIDSLAIARARGLDADLVIAGGGPERAALEQRAQGLGLAGHVRFEGWVHPDDVYAAIERVAAVLVPSRWKEPFGLIALQAAQMGRPVIASDVGGLGEIVIPRETGYLVPPDDAQAMADAILEFGADPGLAAAMGARARHRAIRAFDFTAFVDAYEHAFELARAS